jgi:lipoprotein NlpD
MMIGLRLRLMLVVVVIGVAAGCATRVPAPVVERAAPAVPGPETGVVVPPSAPPVATPAPAVPEKDWRPEFYTVKRGDTLFAIALEHGLDYRELAGMNNIENINVIRVGQVLRLRVAGGTPAAVPPPATAEPRPPTPSIARGNTDTYKSGPKAVKLPFSDSALAQLMATAPRSEPAASSCAAGDPPDRGAGAAGTVAGSAGPPAARRAVGASCGNYGAAGGAGRLG